MQQPLFFEDENEALAHVVACLGGAKKVGAAMRPDLAPDAAGRWVKDCLNTDRRENFHPGHVMWLLRTGRKHGCHALMHWMEEDAGYTKSTPIEPKDEAADLVKQFNASVELLARTAERIGALTESAESPTRLTVAK